MVRYRRMVQLSTHRYRKRRRLARITNELDAARTWAAGHGVILALIPPSVPAPVLAQGTRAEVLAMLDAAQGTEPTKTTRQDRPGHANRTPPAI